MARISDPIRGTSSSPLAAQRWRGLARGLALTGLVYAFLISIGLLGEGFKLFSGGLVGTLIQSASNPVVGLFEGLLVTTLVQSSSTTTSIVVALVASEMLPIAAAIPIIMGANIGTSVTNTLVSLGHITHGNEFRRAFAASVVHDLFNVFAVVVLFPLQLATNFLGRAAELLAAGFEEVGGLSFASPLKLATGPVVDLAAHALEGHPWLVLVLALLLMFASLRYLVKTLKGLVLARVEAFFDRTLFRTAARAMLFGLVLTAIVQSSSITTSLAVPLAGASILTLEQVFPYTLGANVGTTVTAILAALSTGAPAAVAVAFAHLLFNMCGIGIVWPVRAVRRVPLRLAEALSGMTVRNRWVPLVYILLLFYALPLSAILFLR